ncbi:SMP-30/gluconolactonase/LRE family protein [Brucellaceae bacterium C25G]
MHFETLHHHRSETGESPVWCQQTHSLWWCDIHGMSIQRVKTETNQFDIWHFNEPVGCLALTDGGNLILGMKSGFFHFNPSSAQSSKLAGVRFNTPDCRLNDGAVSRNGRFFAAGVCSPANKPNASLYRLDANHSVNLLSGLHVGNGLAFSADDKTLYLSDSFGDVAKIWCFDHDPQSGMISNQRLFHDMRGSRGRPDGGCIDEEGCYWSAAVGAGMLIRFKPDGRVERCIDLPIEKPSKMTFGGKNLENLYITSIYKGTSGNFDGQTLMIKPGIRGLPESYVREPLMMEER